MADLPQVCEELFRILPEEKLSHLRVLQAPGPHTRRHGQRLVSVEETQRGERLLFGGITDIRVGNMSRLGNMDTDLCTAAVHLHGSPVTLTISL